MLADAGLVQREQRTKWAYQRVVPGALEALGRLMISAGDPVPA